MPDPNQPTIYTATTLEAAGSSVNSQAATVAGKMTGSQADEDECAAWANLIGQLEDMLASAKATSAARGCGVI